MAFSTPLEGTLRAFTVLVKFSFLSIIFTGLSWKQVQGILLQTNGVKKKKLAHLKSMEVGTKLDIDTRSKTANPIATNQTVQSPCDMTLGYRITKVTEIEGHVKHSTMFSSNHIWANVHIYSIAVAVF